MTDFTTLPPLFRPQATTDFERIGHFSSVVSELFVYKKKGSNEIAVTVSNPEITGMYFPGDVSNCYWFALGCSAIRKNTTFDAFRQSLRL